LLGCHVARWGEFELMVGWRSYEEGPEAFVLLVYYLLVGFAMAVLRFRYRANCRTKFEMSALISARVDRSGHTEVEGIRQP
jgi:hypothetical protein